MPRPPDNYTHAQFEPVESEHQGETVQCIHCRNWTGSIKTLNRKKAHLLNCPQYATWRAAGNGQDLAPPNKYSKRDSEVVGWQGESDYGYNNSPYGGGGAPSSQPFSTPVMARTRNLETTKYFDEFWDDTSGQKCMRVRCRSCGFVRAKNTTRQVEHLALCQDFLNSTEGQQAVDSGELELAPPGPSGYSDAALGPDIWRGGKPNPNLQVGGRPSLASVNGMRPAPPPPPRSQPSLANHLLNKWPDKLTNSTQHQFLSHAGCGTLSATALSHWLGQNGHISRAMIAFIGNLIGKIRLPDVGNSKHSTQFRALDLLISTVSNLRKEIDFIESTKHKYNIQTNSEPPLPMTKAYVDLLTSSAESRSSLLEGMVALWATENCYCASWQYASTFTSSAPSSNYSVPSYLTSGGAGSNYGSERMPFRAGGGHHYDQHVSALKDALIPNWTSREFSKFVDACRAIVDEIANAETTGSGRDQLIRCEGMFLQVLYLWERIWPAVDGMGEEDVEDKSPEASPELQLRPQGDNHAAGPSDGNGTQEQQRAEPIEIDDDDEGDGEGEGHQGNPLEVSTPFGGTGLGAVAAANQRD